MISGPLARLTEFKQIAGRGTRAHEDTKKFYFTLMDFRGATNHFADPEFDAVVSSTSEPSWRSMVGEPVQIYEPGQNDPIVRPMTFRPRMTPYPEVISVVPGRS
jgi:type I restriction enzyme R subunit